MRFVLREMFEPSAAFERLYGAIGPMHARACAIWARATGAPAESEATRLAVFALIGQVIYFRLARPAVLRRMDWRDIGPAEAAAIKRQVIANLDAVLDLAGKDAPMILETICALALIARILPACAPPVERRRRLHRGRIRQCRADRGRAGGERICAARRQAQGRRPDRDAGDDRRRDRRAQRRSGARPGERRSRQHPLWPPAGGNRGHRRRPQGGARCSRTTRSAR